jgi:hypothetical protein
MANNETENLNISPEEKEYNDLIRRGDDFFKIDLFKSAKEMYEKVLLIKPDDPDTVSKISECKRLIKRDTKRVLIVLPFILIAVITVIWVKMCRF